DPGVLFESVLDCAQRVDGIDASYAVADQSTGESIDNVTWRDSVHPLANSFFFQLAHVFGFVTLDIFAIVEFHFLYDVYTLAFWFFKSRHYGKHSRNPQ